MLSAQEHPRPIAAHVIRITEEISDDGRVYETFRGSFGYHECVLVKRAPLCYEPFVVNEFRLMQRLSCTGRFETLLSVERSETHYYLAVKPYHVNVRDLLSDHARRDLFERYPAVSIAKGALEALTALHTRGLSHRDLRPEHVAIERCEGGFYFSLLRHVNYKSPFLRRRHLARYPVRSEALSLHTRQL